MLIKKIRISEPLNFYLLKEELTKCITDDIDKEDLEKVKRLNNIYRNLKDRINNFITVDEQKNLNKHIRGMLKEYRLTRTKFEFVANYFRKKVISLLQSEVKEFNPYYVRWNAKGAPCIVLRKDYSHNKWVKCGKKNNTLAIDDLYYFLKDEKLNINDLRFYGYTKYWYNESTKKYYKTLEDMIKNWCGYSDSLYEFSINTPDEKGLMHSNGFGMVISDFYSRLFEIGSNDVYYNISKEELDVFLKHHPDNKSILRISEKMAAKDKSEKEIKEAIEIVENFEKRIQNIIDTNKSIVDEVLIKYCGEEIIVNSDPLEINLNKAWTGLDCGWLNFTTNNKNVKKALTILIENKNVPHNKKRYTMTLNLNFPYFTQSTTIQEIIANAVMPFIQKEGINLSYNIWID